MPGQIIKCHGVCAIKPMSKANIVPQEEQEHDKNEDEKRALTELETKQQHLAEVMAAYEFGLQKINELAEIEKVKERELELIHEEVNAKRSSLDLLDPKKKRMLIDIPRLELGESDQDLEFQEIRQEPREKTNKHVELQEQVHKLPKTKLNGKNTSSSNTMKSRKQPNGTKAPSRWR